MRKTIVIVETLKDKTTHSDTVNAHTINITYVRVMCNLVNYNLKNSEMFL